ncbi:SRPBCC family protein [bacterium]|nr:SRPBCC family protein [bacterium]
MNSTERENQQLRSSLQFSSIRGSTDTCFKNLVSQHFEKLERLDDASKSLEYSIVSGPLPVEHYRSTITVTKIGPDQCEVSWSSTFEPKGVSAEQAEEVISGIYKMGFEGLKKLFS